MRKVIITSAFLVLLMIMIVTAPDLKKSEGTGYVNSQFEIRSLKQIEVDEDFPCHAINNNMIVCEPISDEKMQDLSKKLGVTDKIWLALFGVPIRNVKGNAIAEKSLRTNVRNEIYVNTNSVGEFKIGFSTNVFIVQDLSNGVFNNTQELGGNVQMVGFNTSGQYYSQIIDLNYSSILNISYESNEPAGTDILMNLRTFNITNGTDITSGLTGYWRFDGDSTTTAYDYSGQNNTGIINDNMPTAEGKFDNAMKFKSGTGGVQLTQDTRIGMGNRTSFSISAWIKWDGTNPNNNAVYCQVQHCLFTRPNGNYIQFNVQIGGISYGLRRLNTVIDNNWHHIVGVYDGTNMYIYWDGSLGNSRAVSGTSYDSIYDISIGSRFSNSDQYPFTGTIDEVMFWTRDLTPNEITSLYNQQAQSWSEWSSSYGTSPSLVNIKDGRFVQVRANMTRTTGTESLGLYNFSIGYGAPGTAPPSIDNPPTIILTTANDTTFGTENFTLGFSASDDQGIINVSLYTNMSGSWSFNRSLNYSNETTKIDSFNMTGIENGFYIWNLEVHDNSSTGQKTFASNNRTFKVSISCVDTDCHPYVCNTGINDCYTSCNSHSQVNSSSYCANDGTAKPAESSDSDCAFKEWTGLTDDEVCLSQTTGYCYDDNIGIIGEYCTITSDNCVNDGSSYTQNTRLCGFGDGNDYYQCLGGELSWSGIYDCRDLGDPYDASASKSGHTYCGYYYSESCNSGSGCVPPGTPTQDCGNYYYTGSTCGSVAADCDVGCGSTYDSDNCGFPNTLNNDCTCTSSVIDDPPEISLISPVDNSDVKVLNVDFTYTVVDEAIDNCSLYHNSSGVWDKVQTNTTAVSLTGNNIFSEVFTTNHSLIWNVQCYDNASQEGWGMTNYTLTIDTTFADIKMFKWFNNSESNNPLMSISEYGNVNISNDLHIQGDMYLKGTQYGLSPLDAANIKVTDFIDIDSVSNLYVRLTNPYNEYLKFEGEKNNSNLLIGLYNKTPLIISYSGDRIIFGNSMDVNYNLNVKGSVNGNDLNVSNKLYVGKNLTLTNLKSCILNTDVNGDTICGIGNWMNTSGGKFTNTIAIKDNINLTSLGNININGNITQEGNQYITGDIILSNGNSITRSIYIPTSIIGIGDNLFLYAGQGRDGNPGSSGGHMILAGGVGGDASSDDNGGDGGDAYLYGGLGGSGEGIGVNGIDGDVFIAQTPLSGAIGRVGIRTNTPTQALSIAGSVNISNSLNITNMLRVGKNLTLTNLKSCTLKTDANGDTICGVDTGTETNFMNSTGGNFSGPVNVLSGDLGVGTATTSQLLHVRGAENTTMKLVTSATKNNSVTGIEFKVDTIADTKGSDSDRTKAAILFMRDGDRGIGDFRFVLEPTFSSGRSYHEVELGGVEGNTRMIIKSSGNIGIGITTPTEKLHVLGNANVSGTFYYGALKANSPHMMLPDDIGYTRNCVFDYDGYWNLVYYRSGRQVIETNSTVCIDKKQRIDEEGYCYKQNMLYNSTSRECYSNIDVNASVID